MTVAGELVSAGVLLLLGLFGRFAGLGLGLMAATILFIIGGDFAKL